MKIGQAIGVTAVALAILAGGIYGTYLMTLDPDFVAQTDELTFVRHIDKDGGKGTLASDYVSEHGNVPLDQVFTPDSRRRYGADGESPDGVGLKVTFKTVVGNHVLSTKTFLLPQLESANDMTNPQRRRQMATKETEFDEDVEVFTGSLSMKWLEAVIVDTTDGVKPVLAKDVLETIEDVQSGACAFGGSGKLYAYQLTQSAFQGERHRVDLCDKDDRKTATDWLLGSTTPKDGSSVMGGLHGSLGELSAFAALHPQWAVRGDLFTDWIEYGGGVSLYNVDVNNKAEVKELLKKLDKLLDIDDLDLKNVELHLHQVDSTKPELSKLLLAHFAEKFADQGATVVIVTL